MVCRARCSEMDLKTLVKVRETARASVTRIISKWKNILEENSEEKEDELINDYITKF